MDTPAGTSSSNRELTRLLEQLGTLCSADDAELAALEARRSHDMAEAERDAQERARRQVETGDALGDRVSLGSRLRSDLSLLPGVDTGHADPGKKPVDLGSAVREWSSLAPRARAQVAAFSRDFRAWNATLLKRTKARPQVGHDLWWILDRLDLIHRSVKPLLQADVAAEIRAASGAVDVVLQAETAKRMAVQQELAEQARATLQELDASLGAAAVSWEDPRWVVATPAPAIEKALRLGTLRTGIPKRFVLEEIPALLDFPLRTGIALAAPVGARNRAVDLARSLTMRCLAAVPPGGLRVSVVDPVALGRSVAEFRHLAEYDDGLMDEKTWTSERDVERLVDALSGHLEVVISKYLRGQFRSIDEYNESAGEVAEAYRLLLVLDYPHGFTPRASEQLLSLIENGPDCGVFTILHVDPTLKPDRGTVPIDRLMHTMHRLFLDGPTFETPGGRRSSFTPDQAPELAFDADGRPLTDASRLLVAIGDRVRRSQSHPPAVSLARVLPVLGRMRSGTTPDPDGPDENWRVDVDPATWWGATTRRSAMAVLGRSGAQSVTSMAFSSTEVAGGAVMLGLPRSGKTTSLHSMILTMSMLYSPAELELYLLDAKHGVEFAVYKELPHARMVSVHSDREFSLAVLTSIQGQIKERAAQFKAVGAGLANITEYRDVTGRPLARIVLIMDEFHELFEEPDEIGFAAFAAFSDIVRMGPFAGVHVVLSSQTLSAMPAMDRQTLLLLPQRVAFQCNQDDAEILMGVTNRAPAGLSRLGEGVYNPSRGSESRNELFQGLLVQREERAEILSALRRKADESQWRRRPRVFDGQATAERPSPNESAKPSAGRFTFPVGEPFSLAVSESLTLSRARGGNVLLLGDRDDEEGSAREVRGVVHSLLLAAGRPGTAATVVDLVGDDDAPPGGAILDVAGMVGARYVRSAGLAETVSRHAAEVTRRVAAEEYAAGTQVLVLHGIQRALSLSPVDPYDVVDDENPGLAHQLATVVRSGPDVGVHTVVSVDRAHGVQARLGSDLIAEFTLRVAGSACDERDLRLAVGDYGNVRPLSHGQLLLSDLLRGSVKRVRGYGLVSVDEFGATPSGAGGGADGR